MSEYLKAVQERVVIFDVAMDTNIRLRNPSADDFWGKDDLFHQKYRGSRYSIGYPACPNLEDQAKLFALLHPDESIGVHLTTGFLLGPEQSTSAIVVHHPAAKYFVA